MHFIPLLKHHNLYSLKALINWGNYDPNENIRNNLLGLENDEGDTPLHIALENNQEEMARILVEQYSQACYQLNNEKVSTLYLAIKSRYWEVVKLMTSYTKKHSANSEPQLLKGKSVVHAAIDAKNIGNLCHFFFYFFISYFQPLFIETGWSLLTDWSKLI